MNTYEIIKDLAKEKGLSIRQLEINFGYSNGYIGSWKRQTPNSNELSRIADYFDVSVDYLLGRTDTPQFSAKNEREATIEEALNSVMSYDGQPLTDNDREILRGIIEAYLDKKK
ncbi:transcriptional regulator [Enterococcus faecalis]|uniref:helix-turn-helix domain-containing protein n=1 Tax=Enterococcus faecalis TaxID=1351 RepID=UPI000C75F1FE|nr:helix-turn-helix transcriptional regulator [Enterococcus faecalis]PLA80036.1 transcriptional regulator [Enterococcus faecalis]